MFKTKHRPRCTQLCFLFKNRSKQFPFDLRNCCFHNSDHIRISNVYATILQKLGLLLGVFNSCLSQNILSACAYEKDVRENGFCSFSIMHKEILTQGISDEDVMHFPL